MPKLQNNFKFIKDGITIDAGQLERWQWVAIYNDNTSLKQFDETTGFFHQLKEIDQTKLNIFRMLCDDLKMQYDLVFNPTEMKLIHFYRNSILRNDKYRLKSYCFGYEKRVKGVSVKTIATILPNDALIFSDNGIDLVVDIPEE